MFVYTIKDIVQLSVMGISTIIFGSWLIYFLIKSKTERKKNVFLHFYCKKCKHDWKVKYTNKHISEMKCISDGCNELCDVWDIEK